MTGRDRIVIVVVLLAAAIVAPWFLIISPKRDQAAKLGQQVSSAQSQLDSARSLLAQNEAARTSYAAAYATVARLGEAVPPDDDVPSLIYQLQHAASATGVDFRGLQLIPGTPSGTPPAGASSSASQSSTASLPPGATVGPAGFPTEPFTFTFQGNFFHLADFFNRLQRFVVAANNRLSVSGRLMTINAINFGPGKPAGFPQISATISATTYILPASQPAAGGATPGGSQPSSTQAASTSSSSSTPPAATVTPSAQ